MSRRHAFSALVADDERAGRDELTRLLREAGVSRVTAVATAAEALAELQRQPYAAVFLDIQMPGLTGMEAARVINAMPRPPRLVFVTAHADHAVEAFAQAAADYLLKPVTLERLRNTLERLGFAPGNRAAPAAGSSDGEAVRVPRRLAAAGRDGRVALLDPAEVRYCYAQGDSCFAVTRDAEYRVRETLTRLAARLQAEGFVRVHRSYLVNLEHVVEVHPFFGGTYLLKLNDRRGSEVPVSRQEGRKLKLLFGL